MRFERLLQHVQRAEQRVELRATHAQLQWATLKQAWREGWTPGRIVIAGPAAEIRQDEAIRRSYLGY